MSTKAPVLKRPPVLDLSRIQNHYVIHVWNDDQELYQPHNAVDGLELDDGQVFLNGHPIVRPRFERNGLTWSQKTADSYTSAAIHFTTDGLAFAGLIYLGTTERSAVAYQVSGAVPPTVYSSKVAKVGSEETPTAPTAASDWLPGVTVTLGYQNTHPGQLPVAIMLINGMDATSFSYMQINPKNQNLQLQIGYDVSITPYGYDGCPQWPASGLVEFAWDGQTFSGALREYDPDINEPTKLQYAWVGKAQPAQAHARLATPRRTTPEAVAPTLLAEQGLSIAELISITPDGVQDMSFKMLVENMKWAMDPTWLADFFGEKKPVLNQSRIDLIRGDLDFYQQRFAPAYLGLGFTDMAGKGAPTKPLTDAQTRSLKYYLYDGLAKEKGYNLQSNGLFLQAFVASAPRLRVYIDDGGEKWAQQLYNSITTIPQINMMMNRIVNAGSMELCNRYSTLLAALQPSGELATKYHQDIVARSLSQISDSVDLDDVEQIMTWMPDVIQAFINQYIVGPKNPTQEELKRQQAAQDLKEAAEIIGSISDLARAFAEALATTVGTNLLNRASAAQSSFATRHPKLAKAGRFMLVGAWSGGLFSAIIGFEHWDNLPATQKAGLIMSTVSLFGDLVLVAPEILEAGSGGITLIIKAKNYFAQIFRIGQVQGALAQVNTSWFTRAAQKIQGYFDAAKRAITSENTFWGKMFKGLNKILKWLGVAVSAGFAVLSTMQFIDDIKEGKPITQIIFDGIIAASNIAETICITIDVFVATEVFAVAAAILAVVGVIFSIVSLFIPEEKPESLVDKFMDDTLRPFVHGLPEPPKGWEPSKPATALA